MGGGQSDEAEAEWEVALTAPCASFLCSMVPPRGPVRFQLCMSVITTTVDLLATDMELTSPQIRALGFCFV